MSDRDEIISGLRKRFGDEMPILDHIPKNDQSTGATRLEFWAGAVGYQRGMLKTWDGRLLALIVIPAAVAGHLSFWGPRVQTIYTYAEPYIESIRKAALPLTENLVAFGNLPDPFRPVELGLGETVAAIIPEAASGNLIRTGNSASSLTIWRIVQPGFPVLDGRMNLHRGSRWAPPGFEVVYAADSPLGAISEMSYYHRLAMAGSARAGVAKHMELHRIVASGMVERVPEISDEHHGDWGSTQKMGVDWLSTARFPILGYPSTFAPNGFSFVLNLRHPGLVARSTEQFSIQIPLV